MPVAVGLLQLADVLAGMHRECNIPWGVPVRDGVDRGLHIKLSHLTVETYLVETPHRSPVRQKYRVGRRSASG